jgi:perosamine synthetase
MNDFIPVNEPILNGNEGKYVQECIDSGWISSEGPFVDRFEQQFAKRIGRKYGVAVSSGTAGLDIAIASLNIGPGDEVIMPTFTIISCASAVIKAGATPVLVDCNKDNWNMEVMQIESLITPSTVAIMAIHIYGLPVDMNPIFSIAKKYSLTIIEDAAEVIGQTYHGKPCGALGHLSVFSFYPNKHITTGEGGMIVADDIQVANRCRSLRNLCFQSKQRFVHDELGWNYRMSNIQAAIGCAQLEKLDEHIKLKRSSGKNYSGIFKDMKGIRKPLLKTDYAENIYWVFGVVLEDILKVDAKLIMDLLKEQNIGTRPFFWCMHEQPVFKRMGLFKKDNFPVAEELSRRGFYFPSGMTLTDGQVERVGDTFKEILSKYY